MMSPRLPRVAERFRQLAAEIRARQADGVLDVVFEEAKALCDDAARNTAGETQTLLTQLSTAVSTWRQVWPRLGRQVEFRAAVAREAEGWSARLSREVRENGKDQPYHRGTERTPC